MGITKQDMLLILVSISGLQLNVFGAKAKEYIEYLDTEHTWKAFRELF